MLVRVLIVIKFEVLFRNTQNAPDTVAPGLAFDRTVTGVVEVMLKYVDAEPLEKVIVLPVVKFDRIKRVFEL